VVVGRYRQVVNTDGLLSKDQRSVGLS